ncbi:MAG: hypothetical protein RDU83_00390 [bacterium]|nr:hypothetical protein [bacterium]
MPQLTATVVEAPATGSQVATLIALAAELGLPGEGGRRWLADQAGGTPSEQLTRGGASRLIERLLRMKRILDSDRGQPASARPWDGMSLGR